MDFLVVIAIIVLVSTQVVTDKNQIAAGFLFYLPNLVGFLACMISGSAWSRKLYFGSLVFKMMAQFFILPIVILSIDNLTLGSRVCSKLLDTDVNSHIFDDYTDLVATNLTYEDGSLNHLYRP